MSFLRLEEGMRRQRLQLQNGAVAAWWSICRSTSAAGLVLCSSGVGGLMVLWSGETARGLLLHAPPPSDHDAMPIWSVWTVDLWSRCSGLTPGHRHDSHTDHRCTERHGTERNGTERHGMARNGTVRNGNERHGTVLNGTTRYGTVRHGTARYDTARNDMEP